MSDFRHATKAFLMQPIIFLPIQLHVTISKTSVKVVLDCSVVGEKYINAAGNITTDGMEVLGRTVRSRGRQDSSAPVSMNTCLDQCKKEALTTTCINKCRCRFCFKTAADRMT